MCGSALTSVGQLVIFVRSFDFWFKRRNSFLTSPDSSQPARGGKRQGAGRPRSEHQKVPTLLRLHKDTVQILNKLAFAGNLSLGQVVDERFLKPEELPAICKPS